MATRDNRTEGGVQVAKCFSRRVPHAVIRITKRLLIGFERFESQRRVARVVVQSRARASGDCPDLGDVGDNVLQNLLQRALVTHLPTRY